jgi:hypothetical protein
MITLKPLQLDIPDRSLGCGIFLSIIGVVWTGMSMEQLISLCSGWSTTRNSDVTLPFIGGAVLMLLVGLLIVTSAYSELSLFWAVGDPQAGIVADSISPGQIITFDYRQKIRTRSPVTSVGVFLVRREFVEYEFRNRDSVNVSYDKAHKVFDRLVQSCTNAGPVHLADHMLLEQCRLEIPAREMGIKNPYMKLRAATCTSSWVIKVHVNMPKSKRLWFFFEIPVDEAKVPAVWGQNDSQAAGLHDLYLMSVPSNAYFKALHVIEKLLPHLQSGQLSDVLQHRNVLLLERISKADADDAKAELQEAGAVVEIRAATT